MSDLIDRIAPGELTSPILLEMGRYVTDKAAAALTKAAQPPGDPAAAMAMGGAPPPAGPPPGMPPGAADPAAGVDPSLVAAVAQQVATMGGGMAGGGKGDKKMEDRIFDAKLHILDMKVSALCQHFGIQVDAASVTGAPPDAQAGAAASQEMAQGARVPSLSSGPAAPPAPPPGGPPPGMMPPGAPPEATGGNPAAAGLPPEIAKAAGVQLGSPYRRADLAALVGEDRATPHDAVDPEDFAHDRGQRACGDLAALLRGPPVIVEILNGPGNVYRIEAARVVIRDLHDNPLAVALEWKPGEVACAHRRDLEFAELIRGLGIDATTVTTSSLVRRPTAGLLLPG